MEAFKKRRAIERKELFRQWKLDGITEVKLDKLIWDDSIMKLKNCWPLKKPRVKIENQIISGSTVGDGSPPTTPCL